jgi:pimeloyl-ACP methyl ester carboxylesterase
MSTSVITRHFATIPQGRFGPRQVHYRRVGKGPVVICFHQSPMSSRDMIATMQRWQEHFTCIAPDSPGFGLSDPLGVAQAEMSDFADAAIEFMDAIGVERAAVYGFHTGAMISGAIAAAYPERIVCAAANGYVLLTEQERADIVAHYLPVLEPKWDGSHLTWLWARMREQVIFFPWYRKSRADRLLYDLPSPQALHTGLLDFMRSGDHYRVGYRAAFTMRSDVALRDMRVPALITAAATDVLAAQLERVRHPAACVTVQQGGTMEETLDLCRDFILQHDPPAAPPITPAKPLPGRMWSDYVSIPGGQLRLERNDEGDGVPMLVLHDAAGSSDIVRPLASGFIGKQPVLALNLPGHGESDNVLAKDAVTVPAYAAALMAALDALGLKEIDFLGTWGGGLVGLELALQQPTRVRKLIMADALYFDESLQAELREHYTPDIQPVWYGGHLLEAWYLMRDQGLFWPWYRRTREGIIDSEPHVDPTMVNARVLELFRSEGMWRKAYQAHFSYPIKEKLAQLARPVLFAAPEWDPQYAHSRQAAREVPQATFIELPTDMHHWAKALLG